MIDINNTLDLVKLKFFNEWLYTSHLYDENESELHRSLNNEVMKGYFDPLNLAKQANILDIGCGVGYFLEATKNRGYTNVTGITLSENNAKMCREKGYNVKEYDPTFLPQKDGFYDESVDFIYLRHSLHHSPYPIFSLVEYNRVLGYNKKMYIEVPAPDCERKLEYNPSHYSILGKIQLTALLERTGFKIDRFDELDFEISLPDDDKKIPEKYFCILVTKKNPLDIK